MIYSFKYFQNKFEHLQHKFEHFQLTSITLKKVQHHNKRDKNESNEHSFEFCILQIHFFMILYE